MELSNKFSRGDVKTTLSETNNRLDILVSDKRGYHTFKSFIKNFETIMSDFTIF